jgi:hypothetical protein
MFFACDLFGEAQLPDTASPSARIFYSRPVRSEFGSNYRRFHDASHEYGTWDESSGIPGTVARRAGGRAGIARAD